MDYETSYISSYELQSIIQQVQEEIKKKDVELVRAAYSYLEFCRDIKIFDRAVQELQLAKQKVLKADATKYPMTRKKRATLRQAHIIHHKNIKVISDHLEIRAKQSEMITDPASYNQLWLMQNSTTETLVDEAQVILNGQVPLGRTTSTDDLDECIETNCELTTEPASSNNKQQLL